MGDSHIDGFGILEIAVDLAKKGEEFVMATVVWRDAPSSGKQGARAIITSTGKVFGFIGGACAEPVLLREASEALAKREPRLLLLGPSDQQDQYGGHVPNGMTVVPISCQSDGALQIFIEPILSVPHLVVIGRSPMAHTLVQLAQSLDWRVELVDGSEFTSANANHKSIVVVATQGHGDEEVLETALAINPVYIGVVGSKKRGEHLIGFLKDRGFTQEKLQRIRVPIGLDLGRTTHREVAVAVLAELVKMRSSGELSVETSVQAASAEATSIDPVCQMTVTANEKSRPFSYQGQTYYFCCPGCRATFEKEPAKYIAQEASCS
jgi:xanthine dehydrogenase accessory factor